jgi:B12-binding domain/radical SAM domain protein
LPSPSSRDGYVPEHAAIRLTSTPRPGLPPIANNPLIWYKYRMLDLVLLHPPSVYDFRKLSVLHGPISDVIPSTPIFEMYPIGFASLSEYLGRYGYNARIINVAYKMLKSKSYDPERELARIKTRAFGIDLHWMPHVQGAIAMAEMLKRLQPNTPVIFGGFSSTYFHKELLERYEAIDYVVRGDSTEEPLRLLIKAIREGAQPFDVPNITFRDNGKVIENDLTFVPEDLNYTRTDYAHIMRKVMRYRDFSGYVPFINWPQYPITAIFTCRGCTYNCRTCGGSHFAFKNMTGRRRAAFKSPENLIDEVRAAASHLKGPIFFIGDIFQTGKEYGEELLSRLKKERIGNHFVFEFFRPPAREHVKMISQAVEHFNVELSPESHDEKVRHAFGRPYSNADMECHIEDLIEFGCKRIDLFFMTGLPHQTYQSVMDTVDYCDRLLIKLGDQQGTVTTPFISPLAPFVDPGSMVFENPEEYGYKLLFKDVESHRQAMLQPGWKYFLNYETQWMNRDEIVESTYRAALELNRVKAAHRIITKETFRKVEERILYSLDAVARIDRAMGMDGAEREKSINELRIDMAKNISTIGEKKELEWPTGLLRMNFFNIIKTLLGQ